jgi:hypothetical protein
LISFLNSICLAPPQKGEQSRAKADAGPNRHVVVCPLGRLQGRAAAKHGHAKSKDGQAKSFTFFHLKLFADNGLLFIIALLDTLYGFEFREFSISRYTSPATCTANSGLTTGF